MILCCEKVLISNRCISGLMSNLIKKTWMVSNPDISHLYLIAYSLFSDCACWLSFSILKSSSSSSPKDSTTVRFFCLAFLGVDLRMGFCEKKNCPSFLSDFLSGEKNDAQKASVRPKFGFGISIRADFFFSETETFFFQIFLIFSHFLEDTTFFKKSHSRPIFI